MFSPEFMKYLINYQKADFKPEPTEKVIEFKTPRRGRRILAEIVLTITQK